MHLADCHPRAPPVMAIIVRPCLPAPADQQVALHKCAELTGAEQGRTPWPSAPGMLETVTQLMPQLLVSLLREQEVRRSRAATCACPMCCPIYMHAIDFFENKRTLSNRLSREYMPVPSGSAAKPDVMTQC